MMLRAAPTSAREVLLVVLCFLWGVTWPIMRIALYEIPPLSMRTLTAALGALTLYLACRLQGRSLRLPNAKSWAHVTIASLLNIVAFTVFGSFAQLTAATSRVTILAYTMPIWAVLLAWLFLGERPNRMQSFALALCASGLADPDLSVGRNEDCAWHLAGARHRSELGGRHGLPQMGADRGRPDERRQLAGDDRFRRHRSHY